MYIRKHKNDLAGFRNILRVVLKKNIEKSN
jgi:hypothetical protein